MPNQHQQFSAHNTRDSQRQQESVDDLTVPIDQETITSFHTTLRKDVLNIVIKNFHAKVFNTTNNILNSGTAALFSPTIVAMPVTVKKASDAT